VVEVETAMMMVEAEIEELLIKEAVKVVVQPVVMKVMVKEAAIQEVARPKEEVETDMAVVDREMAG